MTGATAPSKRWPSSPANKGRATGVGVIAQEVEAVFPELVATDADGRPRSPTYAKKSGKAS